MTARRQAKTQPLAPVTEATAIIDRGTMTTRGLLFVGDPHISTRGPRRRLETDWMGLTLDKLAQAVAIANQRALQLVCPGDLVDDPRDLNQVLQVRLIRVLNGLDQRMVTTVGNHDKKGTQLADDEVLTLLGEARVVDLIATSSIWGRITMVAEDGRTHRVVIGMTPYGFSAPTSLAQMLGMPETTEAQEAKAAAGADTVVWITHADYAFEGAYPGAADLVAIPGIDMVINGHMHGVKKPVLVGNTVWYCPGNIVRWSVDQADHVPAVWAWDPFDEDRMAAVSGVRVPRLEAIPLRHTPGAQAFDFEGRHSKESLLDEDALSAIVTPESSRFVDGLKNTQMDLRNEGQTGHVQQELAAIFNDLKVPNAAQAILERQVSEALFLLGQSSS